MRLVVFLGLGNYENTTYLHPDPTFPSLQTPYAAEAIATWLKPDSVTIITTKEAEAATEHVAQLKARITSCPVKVMHVALPRTMDDAWGLFDAMAEATEGAEEVALDVTHSYRALPMLAIPVARFLEGVHGRSVRHIYYGNYLKGNHESAVLDLQPILRFMDWSEAADHLQTSSHAQRLRTALVRDAPNSARHIVNKLGVEMNTLTQAVRLARPIEVSEAAARLGATLKRPDVEAVAARLPPLREMIADARGLAARFALEKPRDLDVDTLRAHLDLIEYQCERGLWLQASVVADEWLTSFAMLLEGNALSWTHLKTRKDSGTRLGKLAYPQNATENIENHLLLTPEHAQLFVDAWRATGSIRNNLAHGGIAQGWPAQEAGEKLGRVIDQLRGLLGTQEPGAR